MNRGHTSNAPGGHPPGALQLVEKVRLTPSFYSKLSKSGGNRSISPTFDRLRAG